MGVKVKVKVESGWGGGCDVRLVQKRGERDGPSGSGSGQRRGLTNRKETFGIRHGGGDQG